MRKAILLLLLSFSLSLSAQKVDTLKLTPNGVNGFLVKKFEGKTAEELFKKGYAWTEYNIKSGKNARKSIVENEYIKFDLNKVGEVRLNKSNAWIWALNLNCEIRFKEEKVRIDLKIKEMPRINGDGLPIRLKGGGLSMSVFNRRGKERSYYRSFRPQIEKIINDFAQEIFNSIEGTADYKKEDW